MTAQWPEGEHYNADFEDGWKVELLAVYLLPLARIP